MGDLFGCCGGIAELKSLLAFKFDLDRLFDEQCLLDHLYGMYHEHRVFVSCGASGHVVVSDALTGTILSRTRVATSSVHAVEMALNGDILTAVQGCFVRFWTASLKPGFRETVSYESQLVTCLATAPNTYSVAVGFINNVRLYRYIPHQPTPAFIINLLPSFGRLDKFNVTCLAFSPDGNTVAGQHTGSVLAVVFSGDGMFLSTSGRDGSILLWRTADGTRLSSTKCGDGVTVSCLAASRLYPSSLLAAGASNGTITVWCLVDDELVSLACFDSRVLASISAVVFLGHNDCMIAATSVVDDVIRVWNVAEERLVACYGGHHNKSPIWGLRTAYRPNTSQGELSSNMDLWFSSFEEPTKAETLPTHDFSPLRDPVDGARGVDGVGGVVGDRTPLAWGAPAPAAAADDSDARPVITSGWDDFEGDFLLESSSSLPSPHDDHAAASRPEAVAAEQANPWDVLIDENECLGCIASTSSSSRLDHHHHHHHHLHHATTTVPDPGDDDEMHASSSVPPDPVIGPPSSSSASHDALDDDDDSSKWEHDDPASASASSSGATTAPIDVSTLLPDRLPDRSLLPDRLPDRSLLPDHLPDRLPSIDHLLQQLPPLGPKAEAFRNDPTFQAVIMYLTGHLSDKDLRFHLKHEQHPRPDPAWTDWRDQDSDDDVRESGAARQRPPVVAGLARSRVGLDEGEDDEDDDEEDEDEDEDEEDTAFTAAAVAACTLRTPVTSPVRPED